MSNKIIFIDDDDDLRLAETQGLMIGGFEVLPFARPLDALKIIKPDFEGIIITDIRMPVLNGLEVFEKIKGIDPEIPVIMVTGHGDVSLIVSALKNGVYDVLSKPYSIDLLIQSASRALQKRALVLENRALKTLSSGKTSPITQFMGFSNSIQNFRKSLEQIAKADVDVLIKGETGVGKTTAAKAIHHSSKRKNNAFISYNSTAMPDALFIRNYEGRNNRSAKSIIERAHLGTLFISDIENLNMAHQSMLFDILNNKEFTPSDSDISQHLDFRLVATSSKNLAQKVTDGKFRADLYYHINGVSLTIPPIRERADDIAVLFRTFYLQAAARHKQELKPIAPEFYDELLKYSWPGNVRELEQFTEKFCLGLVDENTDFTKQKETPQNFNLNQRINAFEATLIKGALSANDGNIKKTIESLNVPRRTFYDKISKHKINTDDFKQ